MPPPHFRRWMQKFMKRWHKRNAPGCNSGDEDQKEQKGEKAEKMEGESGEQGENNGEEFLRNVGECVATMLDTFGEFFFFFTVEPPHDKTNKMACAPSEDSDQPGHPPRLIRVPG